MDELIKELDYAKKAVQAILDDSNCNVNFHGIAYWAKIAEDLRQKIKESL